MAQRNGIKAATWGILLVLAASGFAAWVHGQRAEARARRRAERKAQARAVLDGLTAKNAPGRERTTGFDPARLSEADRRGMLAVEQALLTGNAEQAEGVFEKFLPGLLAAGGEPLVQQLLKQTTPGVLRETLLRVCETVWPRTNPDAALAWAAHLPDAAERSLAWERVLRSTADVDPEKAVRAAVTKDGGRTDGGLTEQLVEVWAATDFQGSRTWASNLPPGEAHDEYVARIATVGARSFPEDAARFALKRLPPGPVLDETIITTLYYWSGRNPQDARQWVESLPEGSFRDRAMQEVGGAVTAEDAAATPQNAAGN